MNDHSELVKFLRDWLQAIDACDGEINDAKKIEAATNALEALTAENQRLREALETARAEEREACAKVADEYDAWMMRLSEKSNLKASRLTAVALAADAIATEIRGRR